MSRRKRADAPRPEETPAPSPPPVDVATFAPGDALAAARDAVLQRRAPLAPEPAPPALARGWLAVALLSWGVVVVTFLAPPAALQSPAGTPYGAPAGLQDASLRYGLWLANGAVARFVAREGRLPSFPGEAGITDPAIELEVTGGRSWTLHAPGGVLLTSAMPADAFLGGSVGALRAAPPALTNSRGR